MYPVREWSAWRRVCLTSSLAGPATQAFFPFFLLRTEAIWASVLQRRFKVVALTGPRGSPFSFSVFFFYLLVGPTRQEAC